MSFLPFQAWDDFDTYTIGTNVAGYTLRGGGAPTYKPQYSTTAILPYKRRYLEFLTDATTDYHAVSRDAVDSDANRATFDIVFGFAMSLNTVEELHVYARGQGAGTMTDFVRAAIVLGTGAIRIDKMVGSAYTAGSGASAGTVTLTAGHSYLGRFRGNGGAISLKIWDASLGAFADRQFTGEPTAFNLTPTGFTPTAAGWVAFGGKHSTLTAKVAAFNFDATATNADVAVCPRTNAERTAWLAKQDVLRIVVAKMKATGYDSSGSPYTKTIKAYIANHGFTSSAQDTPALQHFDAAITAVPAISREMPAALSGQVEVKIGNMRVANPRTGADILRWGVLSGSAGAYFSTPDSVAASITGDIDVRCRVALTDWTPLNPMTFVSKTINAGNYAWDFYIDSGGTQINFRISVDGTALSVASKPFAGPTDGSIKWLRATRVASSGVVTFYQSDDGITWSQISTTGSTTAGAMFDGTDPLRVGQGAASPAAGIVYRALIYNGIAGTLVVDFNPNSYRVGTTWTSATAEVWTINGTASVASSPIPGTLESGTRDDWLRVHWLRDGFELLMGGIDPATGRAWPLHDFLHVLRGRLGNPTAPDLKTIEFPIADMSEALQAPLTSHKFTTDDLVGQYFPILLGRVTKQVDLIPVDYANLRYICAFGSMYTTPVYTEVHTSVSDNNVEVRGPGGLTISAVNAGTDTLTASANHGMVDGYRVWFDGSVGSPPAPLANEVIYYAVSTTVGGADFKLSLTRGGAAIDITGTTTGAHFDGYGYDFEEYFDNSRLLTRVRLAASPTVGGRLTMSNLKAGAVYADTADAGTLLASAIFDIGGISLNYKDASKFSTLIAAQSGYKVGLWTDMQPHTINEIAGQIAAGANCWYGMAPDGLIQVGALALPGTSVLSLDRSDIADVHIGDAIRPVDFSKAVVTYAPAFLTQGPITQVGAASTQQPYSTMAPYSYGAAGTPLDDHPDRQDADATRRIGLIASTEATATSLRGELVTLYKHKLGLFDVATAKLTPLEANIGDTVSIDFPRLGFKQWSASDPASPDNTATIDSRLAVVVGHYLKPNKEGTSYSRVDLKVMRRIPGYYATANLN